MGLFPFFNRFYKPGQSSFGGDSTLGPNPQYTPDYSTQMSNRVQNPQAAMMAHRYNAGQMGYQGVRPPQQHTDINLAATMLGNKYLAGNDGIGPDGGMSKWGSAAAKGLSNAKTFFGAMKPGSGSTVANAFGKSSLGKAGGLVSKVGALPGWSMPVAAAAAFQINKRLGQKAHQKDLRRFEDQVRNMSTQQQYEMGLQKPEHNRRAGMLGRLFRR